MSPRRPLSKWSLLCVSLFALAMAASCQKKAEEELPSEDETGGTATAPVVADFTMSDADPQGTITVTLPYTDAQSDAAETCSISDLTFLTEVTPCACAAGVCTVGVAHQTTYADAYGEFKFKVTAGGLESNQATAHIDTKCPAPSLAAGATLTASSTSCPDYSAWNGSIGTGDILVLQEGGSSEGGYILAFDTNGCYKGRATSKGTPWYAIGLKVGSYQNSISTNNQLQILLHTRVQGANNPGLYEWSGPFSSGGSNSMVLHAYGSGLSNPARVPDDNADATADAHLVNVGMDSVLMRYSTTQAKHTTDGKLRVIADNANGYIKGYISGVERTECRIDLRAAVSPCTNCVGHADNTTRRIVTDLFLPQDAFFNEVNYVWYETRTVGGLPRDVWGVGKFNLCRPSTAGFSSLAHADLVSSEPSSSSLLTNAVIKTRTIPNNMTFSNDLFASQGTLGQDYSIARFDFNSTNSSYTRVCTGLQGRALAAYQDHYDNGSTPFYGDLFTIEKDSLGIHLRKYGTSGADEGKLKKTLFTDSLTPASAAAFKQGTTLEGQWIVVIPSIPPP